MKSRLSSKYNWNFSYEVVVEDQLIIQFQKMNTLPTSVAIDQLKKYIFNYIGIRSKLDFKNFIFNAHNYLTMINSR